MAGEKYKDKIKMPEGRIDGEDGSCHTCCFVCAFPQNQSSIVWFSSSLARKLEIARRYL